MRSIRLTLSLILLASIFLLLSCGGDSPPRVNSTVPSSVQPQTVSVTITSGTSVWIEQGAVQQLTASVTGTANIAVVWSLQESNGGSISETGIYTAPYLPGTFHVTATSAADSSKYDTVVITVAKVAIAITPQGVGMLPNGTRTFSSFVWGTIDRRVTWSVQEGSSGGSITADGVYTAPSGFGEYHVVATSLCDQTSSTVATVLVRSSNFTDAGNMSIERYDHTATLLPNGKVLLVGGGTTTNGEYSESKTSELFDPATNTFTPAASMATGRSWHTATLLNNGKVLIAGGGYDFGWDYMPFNSAELYDPASDTFTALPNMYAKRLYHTATLLLNGKVLIAGGYTPMDNLTSAELFDPDTNTFSDAGVMTHARSEHTATLLPDGRVLLAGGWGTSGGAPAAETYDPTTGKFTDVDAYSRLNSSATLLSDGRVLLAGGYVWNNHSESASDALYFDAATGKFSVAAQMNSIRYSHTATRLADGKVLLVGGCTGTDICDNPNKFAELFDPASSTFSSIAGMAINRIGHTATLLPDGRVLVTGGAGDSSAELYTEK